MKKLIYGAIGAILTLPFVAFAGEPVCRDDVCSPTVSVPEPSTLSLMAIALAAVAVIKYKNRNK